MPIKMNAPLQALVDEFLADLAYINRSDHTIRGYARDLRELIAFHQGSLEQLDAAALRDFGARHTHLAPATRARKQAAVSSLLTWAYRHDRLTSNPMLKVDTVRWTPLSRQISGYFKLCPTHIVVVVVPGQCGNCG